ncbi:hypothetical protein BC939DRAFT_434072 [Gamsiella multidivaricata]|uniref:uncharacterized protein n=1 Tax=Gamsiella multidivaricata TaxID=101098 RepID=UPI00221FE2ED|nr:uncharacterized protein BC939DRAFT_434072 [Gamsiella multidivaricata]KAI7832689.1 hypothetical protein BC939DRAFT_434072 [Gamsiella multidivaricata]
MNDTYSQVREEDSPIQPQPISNRGNGHPDHIIVADMTSYGTGDETIRSKAPRRRYSHKSTTSSSSSSSGLSRPAPLPSGLSRFKKATDQIVAARRMSTYAMNGQGVDVSDMDSIFSCIESTVDVLAMDMDSARYTKRSGMNNEEFLMWLEQPRPEWSKVRWININGMSWDVIKAISIKYSLHHLAVEDLLHVPQRTKVDIYPKQTYIALTLLTLMETLENGEVREVDPTATSTGIHPDILSHRLPLDKLDHYKQQYPVSYNREGGFKVELEQVTMFLLDDGTLITMFQVSGKSVVAPIAGRIIQDFSIVRKNNDASFLLQSVIDGIVDHAIPITDAFRQAINELETHVLALPSMKFTKELHQMTAQLSTLKRTLAPTQTLVHALRGKDERSPLSSLSRTYMGDVADHCNTLVEDIDSMLSLCAALIDMIFNLIAYDTNESMRRLALVSIIFLPITFIAGGSSHYYGLRFVPSLG